MSAQTMKASIGKVAGGLAQTAWFVLWLGMAAVSAGLLARLACEAFMVGWRVMP